MPKGQTRGFGPCYLPKSRLLVRLKSSMHTPEIKFIDSARLSIEYLEWQATGARTVVLVHGWPDSARTWYPMAAALANAGYRVLAPSLRGYGGTRFRDASTPRSGELVALGRDLIDFFGKTS